MFCFVNNQTCKLENLRVHQFQILWDFLQIPLSICATGNFYWCILELITNAPGELTGFAASLCVLDFDADKMLGTLLPGEASLGSWPLDTVEFKD